MSKKRQKTAAEIRAKIEALKVEETAATARDREEIGREIQKLTGRETWPEIEPLVSGIIHQQKNGGTAE